MSFLNQLKSQAKALQNLQGQQRLDLEQNCARSEAACRTVLHYLEDLARQLNVIAPPGPKLSLDGRAWWPAMKLVGFRVDARRKMLRDREVFDYVAMGWTVVPQQGEPAVASISVNFPPELQRVESRLAMGLVKHERKELRHPEKSTLQAIRFDYLTETRGNVTVTPDHDEGTVAFRLLNISGFEVVNTQRPAEKIMGDMLDELAKLIVSQPSVFV